MAKTHGNIERMFSTNSIQKSPMVILDFWYLDLGFQDPDPLISVVGLDRPGSGHPKPIWILAYRRFCIFSNFQITEFENILNQIGYEEFIGEFECYIKKNSKKQFSLSHTEWPLLSYQFWCNLSSFNEKLISKQVKKHKKFQKIINKRTTYHFN